jgi:hypothetical protein
VYLWSSVTQVPGLVLSLLLLDTRVLRRLAYSFEMVFVVRRQRQLSPPATAPLDIHPNHEHSLTPVVSSPTSQPSHEHSRLLPVSVRQLVNIFGLAVALFAVLHGGNGGGAAFAATTALMGFHAILIDAEVSASPGVMPLSISGHFTSCGDVSSLEWAFCGVAWGFGLYRCLTGFVGLFYSNPTGAQRGAAGAGGVAVLEPAGGAGGARQG